MNLVFSLFGPHTNRSEKTLPECFQKFYPKCCTIIDYKHHTAIEVLVCITPNGAISWVSKAYDGRTTDVYMVRKSGFLNITESYDQIMADWGFKIKIDLAMSQCTLAIPPSANCGAQMITSQTKQTSTVTYCRIYVEQTIEKLKDFRILKGEICLLYFLIADDIIKVCSALTNLKRRLKSWTFVR